MQESDGEIRDVHKTHADDGSDDDKQY